MTYEYTIEFFSLQEAGGLGETSDTPNLVYACGEAGECTIRDLRVEQVEHLQEFLNEMGKERWELVQIFFYRIGAVSFWKRSIEEGND
ncbi:MAG: hypothetical protein H6Q55_2821 [Deltaproteobacteria bacterium]|nr:hypothetical protein [Deltaproteobacteria bacterium]